MITLVTIRMIMMIACHPARGSASLHELSEVEGVVVVLQELLHLPHRFFVPVELLKLLMGPRAVRVGASEERGDFGHREVLLGQLLNTCKGGEAEHGLHLAVHILQIVCHVAEEIELGRVESVHAAVVSQYLGLSLPVRVFRQAVCQVALHMRLEQGNLLLDRQRRGARGPMAEDAAVGGVFVSARGHALGEEGREVALKRVPQEGGKAPAVLPRDLGEVQAQLPVGGVDPVKAASVVVDGVEQRGKVL
mmetsp:Transcript_91026/g.220939  ORF Transcript_91026/g.220939 Transcript_91026/m.220939 type:complete len:249 (-) Transcript_91026:81-827(-)